MASLRCAPVRRAGFDAEQMLLRRETAGESRQLAGRSDDAVARRDDRDRIPAIRRPDRAERRRLADLFRDLAVAAGLAERNREERFPDLPLKLRAGKIEPQIEGFPLAGKIFF